MVAYKEDIHRCLQIRQSRRYSEEKPKSFRRCTIGWNIWLEYLAGQSYIFGALGIVEAILFLWKEYFKINPLYEQVTTLLLFRGSEQQGWFPTANHKLPITEELSKFQISSSECPG
jgi:hypothetical protein